MTQVWSWARILIVLPMGRGTQASNSTSLSRVSHVCMGTITISHRAAPMRSRWVSFEGEASQEAGSMQRRRGGCFAREVARPPYPSSAPSVATCPPSQNARGLQLFLTFLGSADLWSNYSELGTVRGTGSSQQRNPHNFCPARGKGHAPAGRPTQGLEERRGWHKAIGTRERRMLEGGREGWSSGPHLA